MTSHSRQTTMKTARWATTALALFSALQLAACDSPTSPKVDPEPDPPIVDPGDPPVEPKDSLTITTVSRLVPGSTARLEGKRLSEIKHLTIEGQAVSFNILSDSVLEFTVPQLRACETDGRSVQIVAEHGKARIQGTMTIQDALRIEVGESRVLAAEELTCIQLPAGDEDYILSITNLSRDTAKGPRVTVHGLGTSGSPPSGTAMAMRGAQAGPGDVAAYEGGLAVGASLFEVGEPFDNYVGAQVGDTLRFVDWDRWPEVREAKTKDEVPYYEGLVVAATPSQIVVVDLREADAPNAINHAAEFQRAAEIAEQYMLPAVRATISPDVTLPHGRMVTMVTSTPSYASGTTYTPMLMGSQWSSGMFAIKLAIRNLAKAEYLAGTMIHELTHIADASMALRGRSPSVGWIAEALAVNAEDYAAHLARGGTPGLVAPAPNAVPEENLPAMALATSVSLSPVEHSPYKFYVGSGFGAYDRGARLLRYAAQQVGGMAELYGRLLAAAPPVGSSNESVREAWSIDRVAEVVGMSTEQLVSESVLAELTDGLVPAEIAAQKGLPQIDAWDYSKEPLSLRTQGQLLRTQTTSVYASIVGGGYVAWSIPGRLDHGLSIQGDVPSENHEVRLTRVR